MKIPACLLAAALAIAVAGPARADPRGGTDPRSGIDLEQAFKKADIDGDHAVSKAEAAGNERLVIGFDRADRNHDGKLSRAEFDSVYQPKKARAKARTRSAKAGASASVGSSRK